MPFRGEVVVRQETPVEFRLLEPLSYRGRWDTFTVPAGFLTDFASVPRAFVWLLPRYGLYTPAAILHDFLVETATVSRRDPDGLFRRSMRELGVTFPRRWSTWAAVRTASFMSGASALEWLQFLAVIILALPFVAIPAAVVQFWLGLFWLLEGAFWLIGRLLGKHAARPTHPAKT